MALIIIFSHTLKTAFPKLSRVFHYAHDINLTSCLIKNPKPDVAYQYTVLLQLYIPPQLAQSKRMYCSAFLEALVNFTLATTYLDKDTTSITIVSCGHFVLSSFLDATSANSVLPTGWESAITANGLRYYIK